MKRERTVDSTGRKPLRLWPGVALALLLCVSKFLLPLFIPDQAVYSMLGALACGLLIVIWWLAFSRAPWQERLGGLALMVVALLVTRPFLHESIDTAGMGLMFPILSIPLFSLALVIWALATRDLFGRSRWWTMIGAFLIVSIGWTLLRTDGVTNDGNSDFAWRWSKTAEDRLLERSGDGSVAAIRVSTETGAMAEWPGFRGPGRRGMVSGTRIETDWSKSPPVEIWRRAVGPGWSSFAVQGDLFYTQEQRGDYEVVSCYQASTGEPIWQHRDLTRFWESNAGAGPRATPTLHGERVYSSGATGMLNVLDARDGTVIWSRNAADDIGAQIPTWGFSGSPVVVGDVVVTALRGVMVAYDRDTGESRWTGPDGGDGYSSPHLLTIDGVEQVILASQHNVVSFSPSDGKSLWLHDWKGSTRIVQPAQIEGGDLLISQGNTTGIRRVAAVHESGGWSTEERWTSNRLKPYFSDFVIHQGNAYGFDGNILASIELETGERNWKGGRYGSGQMVLLAEQDLLLVISEKGELALVSATPEQFTEIARSPALRGKTWNHPVVVDSLLLVRNSEEMAAFRLPTVGG